MMQQAFRKRYRVNTQHASPASDTVTIKRLAAARCAFSDNAIGASKVRALLGSLETCQGKGSFFN